MKSNKNYFKAEIFLTISSIIITISMVIVMTGCASYSYKHPRTDLPDMHREFSAKVYFIDQKFWSIGDKFTITDERGNPVFYVKEKFLTIGDRLSFMDEKGSLIFYIKQKVLSLNKQYRIYNNKKLVARVIKKFKPFNDKFIIDLPGDNDYIVRGDFISHRYSFIRDGKKVAQISKKWNSITDNYMVEIGPREDDLIILAAAVIIDMASHKKDS